MDPNLQSPNNPRFPCADEIVFLVFAIIHVNPVATLSQATEISIEINAISQVYCFSFMLTTDVKT